MLDTRLQAELAKSCTAIALSYANAATAAYAAMMTQALDCWLAAVEPPAEATQNTSRRLPQRSLSLTLPSLPFGGWGMPGRAPSNPLVPWLDFFPARGPVAAWPMAFVMIAVGVPRSVAWPAAEANAATMEAMELAGRSFEAVFSSYRSDGGHAVAPWPAPARAATAAMAAPLSFAAMAPWFEPWRIFG